MKSGRQWVLMIATAWLCLSFSSADAQVSWSTIGPGGGGWLTAITIVDDAAGPIYVGCDVGGIYRSRDDGESWEILDAGLSDYYVQDIAYDFRDPSILYAATRGGIFKSADGGESWAARRIGFPPSEEFSYSAPVSDILVDPVDPNILYAGIGVPRSGYVLESYHWQMAGMKGTIYKSQNSGESWTPIRNTGIDLSAMIYSLAIDASDTNLLYAATSSGVYRSDDAGATWEARNSGLPTLRAMGITIDPQNPQRLFVTLWAEPGSDHWDGGVFRSTDGGNSWIAMNRGLPHTMGSEEGLTSNYPAIVMDPGNPLILYVGNNSWTPDPGIYKSVDGGESWSWVSRFDEGDANVEIGWIAEHGLHIKCMALDPQHPERVYAGTSTHLLRTEDGGGSWTQIMSDPMGDGYWGGRGFETTCVQDIAVDPIDPKKIYAGYWDMGFLKSRDGGISFKRTFSGMNYRSNTFAIIVDPALPNRIFATTGWWESNQGEVCVSVDYGESWTVLDNGLPDAQVWSMALDESSPPASRRLYAASFEHGVYRSTDGGKSWLPAHQGLGVEGNLRLRKIIIDPHNPNVLYAGIEAKEVENGDHLETIQGGLFRSVDAGLSWTRMAVGTPRLIDVQDIAIDPSDSRRIYLAVSSRWDHSEQLSFPGGVYKSVDGGISWTHESAGFGGIEKLNVVSVAINRANRNIIYAATTDAPFHDRSSGRGIFRSSNGGKCWFPINHGLGIHSFDSFTIDPSDPSILYAGSAGNGLWKGKDSGLSDAPWTCRLDREDASSPD